MKFVYYPSDLPGDCDNIAGFVSSTKDVVSLKVGEMKELDDKVAEELKSVFKFLEVLDEEQYARLFPLRYAKRAKKLEKESKPEKKPELPKPEVEKIEEKREDVIEEIEVGEFECKVCGKVCKTNAGLSAHMRSHDDEELT